MRWTLVFGSAGLSLATVGRAVEEPEYSVVNLHPPGADYSCAMGVSEDGRRQVGYAGALAARAWLWEGSSVSGVNLHPQGFWQSECWAVSADGTKQAGYVSGDGTAFRAARWNSTAATFENLHPPAAQDSFIEALSRNGNVAVGHTVDHLTGDSRAALWQSNAYTTLHMDAWQHSKADTVSASGKFQAGTAGSGSGGQGRAIQWMGFAGFYDHSTLGFSSVSGLSGDGRRAVGKIGDGSGTWSAGIWRRPGWSSFEILWAVGSSQTVCKSISPNGVYQAGWGWGVSEPERAAVWSGSPFSHIDLHSVLGAGFTRSNGFAVSDNGDVVGRAFNAEKSRDEAVLWRRNWACARGEPMSLFKADSWGQLTLKDAYLKHVSPFPELWPGSKVSKVAFGPKSDMTRVSLGGTECVGLVRALTGLGPSAGWSPSAAVVVGGKVRLDLRPGTAIATFDENDRYASVHPHTAIVMGRIDESTIEVVDQNFFSFMGFPGIVAKHQRITIGGIKGTPYDLSRYRIIKLPR